MKTIFYLVLFLSLSHFINAQDTALSYDYISPFSNGLAAVMEDNKWGYIDKYGIQVINSDYESVKAFNESGYAPVKKEGKWGFIDKKGKKVIDFEYDEVGSFTFADNSLLLATAKKNGKWGFIDEKGNPKIDFQYRRAKYFSEGIANVLEFGGGWKYIDVNEKPINNIIYKGAFPFKGGYALVREKDCGYKRLITTEGKATRYIFEDALSVSEGWVAFKLADLWGFLNLENDKVIEAQYEEVQSFSEGYATVKKNGLWGYINKDGNEIINRSYRKALPFYNNYALVKDLSNKWICIEKEGEKYSFLENYTLNYDDFQEFGNDFSNTLFSEGIFSLKTNTGWHIVNTNFSIEGNAEWIEPSEYELGRNKIDTTYENNKLVKLGIKTNFPLESPFAKVELIVNKEVYRGNLEHIRKGRNPNDFAYIFSDTLTFRKNGDYSIKLNLYWQGKKIISSEEYKIYYELERINVFLLSVGGNPKIGPSGRNLSYTGKDAVAFSKIFLEQENKLYKKVEPIVLVPNDFTKINIYKHIGNLKRRYEKGEIQDNDMIVLFFATHGDTERIKGKSRPFLYANDYHVDTHEETTIFIHDLIKKLESINCKKLLFLDACYSGKNLGDLEGALASRGTEGDDFDKALEQLKLSKDGWVIFASSESDAYEHDRIKHGLFTQALIDVVKNCDNYQDGLLRALELDGLLESRVNQLLQKTTGNQNIKQTPKLAIIATEREHFEALPIFQCLNK